MRMRKSFVAEASVHEAHGSAFASHARHATRIAKDSYSASKAALNDGVRAAWPAWEAMGVRGLLLHPGGIATQMITLEGWTCAAGPAARRRPTAPRGSDARSISVPRRLLSAAASWTPSRGAASRGDDGRAGQRV